MQKPSSFQVYNASAGSGKTFTLVKEYLKILLLSDNYFLFQKILAITFTNKAAGEMKDRILKNLVEFTKGEVQNSAGSMFFLMQQETKCANFLTPYILTPLALKAHQICGVNPCFDE